MDDNIIVIEMKDLTHKINILKNKTQLRFFEIYIEYDLTKTNKK